ncbi:MAG: hypothetical protein K9M98_10290 [Cephaloticoccus sp.]|nr:hypothetical protein [Cephaloticoccus sp.]MCF7760882.1 hypothetical protein [Cephaloticoccus sp.]
MGKIGKDKVTLCAVVERQLLEVIESRRDALTLSRSAYTALILKKWQKDGFPPVSSADLAILELTRKQENR